MANVEGKGGGRGGAREKNDKIWHRWCWSKNAIKQMMGKWIIMKNCANLLPLKSKLPGKFYRFNSTDRGIEMLETAEFGKKEIKWEIS